MLDETKLSDEQKKRLHCMHDFLQYLNKYSGSYILKGGTALMFHYGLPRFSEDIDLDSNDAHSIRTIMDKFCKQYGYTYNIKIDTDFTLRFMLKFALEYNPLKIEVSFRRSEIPYNTYKTDNNIKVYNIDALAGLKLGAYGQRDKIRDLFDCSFIINNYYEKLSSVTINNYISTFQHKGLEQLDYLVETQADPLIDPNILVESFLTANDKLGLLAPQDNMKISSKDIIDKSDSSISTDKASLTDSKKISKKRIECKLR